MVFNFRRKTIPVSPFHQPRSRRDEAAERVAIRESPPCHLGSYQRAAHGKCGRFAALSRFGLILLKTFLRHPL